MNGETLLDAIVAHFDVISQLQTAEAQEHDTL